MRPGRRMGWAVGVETESPRRFRKRLKPRTEKASVALRARPAPSASREDVRPRARTASRGAYPRRRESAAGRCRSSRASIPGRRQDDIGGPARHRAGGEEDRVADRLVTAAAPVEHPREHRDVEVRVVVDAHFALAVVQPVQPAGVLRDCAPPRDRQREEQRVEARIVEALAQYWPVARITRGSSRGSRPAARRWPAAASSQASSKHTRWRTLAEPRSRRSRCSLRSVSTSGDRPSRTDSITSSQMRWLRARPRPAPDTGSETRRACRRPASGWLKRRRLHEHEVLERPGRRLALAFTRCRTGPHCMKMIG